MVIVEEPDRNISDVDYLKNLYLVERSQILSDIREQWIFDWMSTDFYRLIDAPAKTAAAVKTYIENYKDTVQKETYDYYVNQAKRLPYNPYAMETALHRFYEFLISDCMTVIKAFRPDTEYSLWNSVKVEYENKYRDYAQEAQDNPLDFAVQQTIEPIVSVAADIVATVAEPVITAGATAVSDVITNTASNVAQNLLGENWKPKLYIGLAVFGGIVIFGLIGYQYSKTYITEKAKKRAD